mgnify:CR=1 FL=1
MKRPKEIRAAPKEWVSLLRVTYPLLREQGTSDLLLYGSQAMSVYMKNALRSKDLDLLSSQVSFHQMDMLADKLSEIQGVQFKTTTVQTRRFEDRKMTTYAIELRVNGKPFFVEIFDKILDGRPPSILRPYVEPTKRWALDFWSPTREAVVTLRLAFRPPEGITRLNAVRLNSFIQENRRALDFKQVAMIAKDWGIEDWIENNLTKLYQRNKIRILGDNKIIPGIEGKMKVRSRN